MILLNIFFDVEKNFQWASIAAIVSSLALCSTVASIIFTNRQAKQNRKSATLVKIRLEELKDLREEVVSSISLINAFIADKNTKVKGNKPILKSDSIIAELNASFNKTKSILYRRTKHAGDFSVKISTCQLKLMMLEDTLGLTGIGIELNQAIDEYSVIEWNEVEKYI